MAKRLGNIAFIVDERISRDRRGILSRIVNALRHVANVQLISGDSSEKDVLAKLEATPSSLVLAPWYRYLSWRRIEALYGMTRTSGPTFAGYFCEPLSPQELGPQAEHLRAILLDFAHLNATEAMVLLESLLQDQARTGLRPLLDPATPVYCENWYQGTGLGLRIDQLLQLPEIAKSDWAARAPALRILMSAFWSLIYEEGPGKSELGQAITGTKSPRACFQIGASARCLAIRLCFSMPGWSAKDALSFFWPDPSKPSSAAQLLLKHADFLRAHTLSDSSDVEVVAGLFHSAPSEKAHAQMRTLWVEPLSPNLVSEVPFDAPGPHAPHLRLLPSLQIPEARAAETPGKTGDAGAQAKERFIFEAAVKIRELKKMVADRDDLIKDLKTGGVGAAAPLSPPDADALLEAFQERYFEARLQIRQLEAQVSSLEQRGSPSQEVEAIRLKIAALTEREHEWIRKLAATIETYRTAKRQSG